MPRIVRTSATATPDASEVRRPQRLRPTYDASGFADSQCWFPPLELAALVSARVIDPAEHSPVLDVGCGLGTEAVFLSRMGWKEVYGVDADEDAINDARGRGKALGGKVTFAVAEFAQGRPALPRSWPDTFRLVLDRLFINNFGPENDDNSNPRAVYFARMSELVAPGGLLVVRDRLDGDMADATFRRLLFAATREADFFRDSRGEQFFEPLGPVLNVRLVGDDTDDGRRLDAMIPVKGVLAVLRRKSPRPRGTRSAPTIRHRKSR